MISHSFCLQIDNYSMPIDFGRHLTLIMMARDMTQADLAKKAGVSRAAISDVISGRRMPGPELCRKIAKPLGLSDVTLFRWAGLLEQVNEADELTENIISVIQGLSMADKKEVYWYCLFRKQMSLPKK